MKRFTLAIASVAVIITCATAFTTGNLEHRNNNATSATIATMDVAQVIITGKRMSSVEKAQFDAQQLAPTTQK